MEELPGKLQNWYLQSYPVFIIELGKRKKNFRFVKKPNGKLAFCRKQNKL